MQVRVTASQDRRGFFQHLFKLSLLIPAILGTTFSKAFSNQDQQNPILATVKIAENTALDKPGGFVLVKNTPVGDVLIVRVGEERYIAMSDVCPHKQCRVEVKSPSLIKCPCHGSTYAIDGTYISGPAHKSLRQFHLSMKDGVITVTET